MKTIKLIILGFLFIISIVSFSQNNKSTFPTNTYETMGTNYLAGLNSGNNGLQVSSGYLLGKIKSGKAVTPLMKMFNEVKNDSAKPDAGWSLLKIGDSSGIYLVRRTSDL